MTRVGLVLCAGGTVGQAYHAGVLAALEHDFGWDPRKADVIVGTSAGSVTGTLLRIGVPAHDLAAWAVQAPLSVESAPFGFLEGDRPRFPPLTVRHWVRPWRLPSPQLLGRVARRPWAFRPSVAAMTLMPTGRVDIVEHADRLAQADPGSWPAGLYVCAARRSDGRRVVFGRDGSPTASVPEAVAASCAIPGYFSPVRIGGIEYFDGGVHSPSNADVLCDERLDLVIVVSPMSAARGLARTGDAMLRLAAHRRLERELRRVRRNGTSVVRFEPGRRTLAAMGLNMMADDRSDRVVQAAFIESGAYAGTSRVTSRLAPIDHRHKRHVATA
jgi:NTE family protein